MSMVRILVDPCYCTELILEWSFHGYLLSVPRSISGPIFSTLSSTLSHVLQSACEVWILSVPFSFLVPFCGQVVVDNWTRIFGDSSDKLLLFI